MGAWPAGTRPVEVWGHETGGGRDGVECVGVNANVVGGLASGVGLRGRVGMWRPVGIGLWGSVGVCLWGSVGVESAVCVCGRWWIGLW